MNQVRIKGKGKILYCKDKTNLFNLLGDNGYIFKRNCGGNHKCNNCKVIVYENNTRVVIRACDYFINSDIEVELESLDYKEEILLLGQDLDKEEKKELLSKSNEDASIGIAVDIGTTTIGAAAVNLKSKEIICEAGTANSQAAYGGDVTSRIKTAATKEGCNILRDLVREDIKKTIARLGVNIKSIEIITISANTAMTNIFLGYPVKELGEYPFTANTLGDIKLPAKELFGDEYKGSVFIMPCLSGFIGSDIIGGAAYAMGNKQYELLIDFGTNGEMILKNNNKYYATSTAAGPAFEGCFRGRANASTVLDAIANSYSRGYIDETGLICDHFFNRGISCDNGIVITQTMVRDIQLAKGAIMAGIIILGNEANVGVEQIEKIYLAGGFGFNLNINSGIKLKMLPKDFLFKVETVGNSSLLGAIEYMCNGAFRDKCKNIICNGKNIDLANQKEFSTMYIDYINF